MHQARHKPVPPRSEYSNDVQKEKFQLAKESSKNLGLIPGKISNDLSRGSDKTPVKAWDWQSIWNYKSITLNNESRNDSTEQINKKSRKHTEDPFGHNIRA